MKIPDQVRKTVGFICFKNQLNGEAVPIGSFFFLGHDPAENSSAFYRTYAVTVRHVIDELIHKGCSEAILRLNTMNGTEAFITIVVPLKRWFFHPSDSSIDVAITEVGLPNDADHLAIPFSYCATPEILAEYEVGLGDEVFVSGLFRHHYGKKRNIPIVRVGTLAAFNEERIATQMFGEMDAHLIESRSIGGLSGSPVFLNLGVVRQMGGQILHKAGTGPGSFLLGMTHGHFDELPTGTRGRTEIGSDLTSRKVNAGIAIVIPFESILSVVQGYEAATIKS